MRTLLSVIMICASGAFAIAAKADTDEPNAATIDEAVITTVSPDPFASSGVFATAVEISGTSKGVTAKYYLPYMTVGQAKPRVGQTCKLGWRWHDAFGWVTAKGSVRGVRLVTEYSCADGSRGSFR